MKIEYAGIKTYINSQVVIIPTSQIDELKKLPNGELLKNTAETVNDRQQIILKQHNLYWASCHFIAENSEDENFRNKYMVDEWCKKECGLIEFTQYFTLPDGTVLKHEKTGSISFDKLPHLERCAYFSDAFPMLASHKDINMHVDDFINAVKETMGGN